MLQQIVAKHYCPTVVDAVHSNEFASNLLLDGTTIYVYSKNANTKVEMVEWVEKKGPLLSWILKLNQNKKSALSCKRKTNKVESDLLNCPSKFTSHASTR